MEIAEVALYHTEVVGEGAEILPNCCPKTGTENWGTWRLGCCGVVLGWEECWRDGLKVGVDPRSWVVEELNVSPPLPLSHSSFSFTKSFPVALLLAALVAPLPPTLYP